MDSKTPESLWLEYISKLIDRSLRRRQSSGFTNWAICGVLAFLLYRIIDGAPNIFTDKNSFINFLIILTNIFNIIFSIALIMLISISQLFESSVIRIIPTTFRYLKIFISAPLLFLFSLLFFLNICVFIIIPFTPRWPYLIIASFLLLNILGYSFSNLRIKWKMKKEYEDLPFLEINPLLCSKKTKRYFMIGLFSYSFFIFIIAIINFYCIIDKNLIDKTLTFPKLSLDILAFLFVGTFLILRLSSLAKSQFMENLERRIVLEDLRSTEIKSIFIKEYLGETLPDWFNNVNIKYNELHDQCQTAIKDAEEELLLINGIDKEYTYEIKGRFNKILDNVADRFDNYQKYNDKILKHIHYLIDQKAAVAGPDIFKQFISTLESQFKEIESSHLLFYQNMRSKIKDY